MNEDVEIAGAELVRTSAPELSGLAERYRALAGRFTGSAVLLRDLDRSEATRASEDAPPDGPLDVVIDATTRGLGATRASFESLFPRIGPGGIYVVEGWNAQPAGPEIPREHLVLELMLARLCSDGGVEMITVDEHWLSVLRGDAVLDPTTFHIEQLYTDHFHQLALEATA